MLRLRAFCFAMMTCLALLPSVSGAQEAPVAPAVDAREAFRRGEAAYSAGNYEMAIREWNNAYAADPRPRIQFNLSQAYERTGELDNAVTALKKFLESADPDDPMYSDANARLSALQTRIAATGVLVRGGSEGGLILLDDQDWGRTPRPDKLTVRPGSHTLVVRWAGRPEFRTNVVVPAGQVVEVQLPADAGAGAAPVPGPVNQGVSTSVSTSSGGSNRKLLLYVFGGVAAGAGVGLLAYGAVRGGDVVNCGGKTYCPDPGANDSAKHQSLGGYVAGGALLAGGAAMIITAALLNSGSDKQAKTQCGIGLASAACRFRF